ncbi:hypothetical protein D3C73_1231740 [compost metagenome]
MFAQQHDIDLLFVFRLNQRFHNEKQALDALFLSRLQTGETVCPAAFVKGITMNHPAYVSALQIGKQLNIIRCLIADCIPAVVLFAIRLPLDDLNQLNVFCLHVPDEFPGYSALVSEQEYSPPSCASSVRPWRLHPI